MMKIDKKKVTAAANELLKELDLNNDIITAVINEKVRDRNIVASLNIGHNSFEIWKRKDGHNFDVVKSTYQSKDDFKKVLSKKQIKDDVLVDIINKLIELFTDNEDERKQLIEKLNANKQNSSKQV